MKADAVDEPAPADRRRARRRRARSAPARSRRTGRRGHRPHGTRAVARVQPAGHEASPGPRPTTTSRRSSATSPAPRGRAVDAGFDAVELHFGHGYLPSAFLSPQSEQARRPVGRQRREPGPAGARRSPTARARARSATEWRSSPSSTWPTACRADSWLDDSIAIGAGCSRPTARSTPSSSPAAARSRTRCTCSAAMRRSREMAAAFPQPIRTGFKLFGQALPARVPVRGGATSSAYARQFRDALSMPLILLGGINRLDTIQAALDEGFEFVAMARALLREPDLINRMADRRRRPRGCASTATSACRRSTAAPTACWCHPTSDPAIG